MQHPTPQNISEHSTFTLSSRVGKKSMLLPEYYTTIDPVMLKSVEPSVPAVVNEMASDVQSIMTAKADDCAWLGCVEGVVVNSSNAVTEHLTWSAFHSDKQPQDSIDSAVT
jgi:hypothetical protein